MSHNPLEQFKIRPIFELAPFSKDSSFFSKPMLNFTNSSLFMTISLASILILFFIALRNKSLVPKRTQSLVEMVYEFVYKMLNNVVGEKGAKFFPFVFSLFLFIAFSNLIGIIPGSFTVTSHFAVNFAISGFIFILLTFYAIFKHGFKFLSLFLPSGAPMWLLPLLMPLELMSYLIRPLTLCVRLTANMIVGHIIIKIAAGLVILFGFVGGGIIPFSFLVLFTGFEIFVALLQAYVFAILTCVYIKDAVHLH